MASTPRSMSPTKRKPTAKPAHRTRRRIDVDPIGRKENRKDKQRGYEKGYRKRQKDKRADDEVEWMQLEAQVRTLLAKRTAAVVIGPQDELAAPSSTVSIRQRYLELLQEERALREAEALDRCMAARDVALSLWGRAPPEETCASSSTRSRGSGNASRLSFRGKLVWMHVPALVGMSLVSGVRESCVDLNELQVLVHQNFELSSCCQHTPLVTLSN